MQKAIILTLLAFIIALSPIASSVNPSLATAGNIMINEVELNPPGTDSGAEEVELYNPSNNDVDVSGWSISSTAGRTATVMIDEGTIIASKGHLIVGRGSQWLDNVDEVIVLKDDTGVTVDSAGPFSDEDNDDATWQRSPDGSDNWVFTSSTLGGANFGTFISEPEPSPPPTEPEQPSEDEQPEITPPSDSDSDPESDVGLSTQELKIVVIDVGQGLSELVILPNKKTMLIDGGERNQGETILSVLQENGIDRIDVVVGTHPHADHIGGLIDVLNTVDAGQVLDSGQIHTTQTFEDYLDAIEANQIPLTSVHEGDSIDLDPSVQLDVLNPPATLPDGEDNEEEFNNNSVVIKLTYGEFAIIFTGDMEEGNEARLASNNLDIDANVLVAGHHGSRTASTSAFLNAVSPEVVIISLGADNTYGHPHQEVLDRIEAAGTQHILRTDIDGTVTITTRGNDEYMIETSESNKTVVVPEFQTAILIVAITLISVVALTSRGRIWTLLGRV